MTFLNGFREVIGDMGKQSPVMMTIAAKPDLEWVPMCGESSPHRVSGQRVGERPQFVEEPNRAVGLAVAKKMNTAELRMANTQRP